MTNRMWVRLHMLWKAVSSHLFLWPTVCEWDCTFCEGQSCHIVSYDAQDVSEIPHFVKGSPLPMTNRKWATLHLLWKAVSWHLFLWPTGSEWHCTFCEWQSHHMLSYDQQNVSDIAHFWKRVSSHLFLWPTVCEWHCTCERQSHHIFSYHQQLVSPMAHVVKGSLITTFPMTNSLWVRLHILWRAFMYIVSDDQQDVSDMAHFVKDNLITPFPITNSMWVRWHILWKTVSSHHFLWPTGSEWDCTFCERQSHHVFSCDQQNVCDIAHFVKGSLMTSFPITNRMWALDILCKSVSSHLFLWQTVCE